MEDQYLFCSIMIKWKFIMQNFFSLKTLVVYQGSRTGKVKNKKYCPSFFENIMLPLLIRVYKYIIYPLIIPRYMTRITFFLHFVVIPYSLSRHVCSFMYVCVFFHSFEVFFISLTVPHKTTNNNYVSFVLYLKWPKTFPIMDISAYKHNNQVYSTIVG